MGGYFATVNKQAIGREKLTQINHEGVFFPVSACSIPMLSGRLLLPFLQLLKAKQVTFMSATIPENFSIFIKDLAMALLSEPVKTFAIEEIPFKFNVTCLKTNERLSLDKQAKIVKELSKKNPDENIFVCTARKSESEPLYGELRLLGDVALYYRKDWNKTEESRFENIETEKKQTQEATIRKIVTYSRSAITRGANFPKVCIAMIDCNQFIPQASLDNIRPGISKEEIASLMTKEIKENLTQIVGRFFRSELQRTKETQIDKRQIVIFLHGLPDEVQTFTFDERLLAEYKEYRNESFLSLLPKYETVSVIDAIETARKGLPVPDRKKIDHDNIFKKAMEKGIDSITQDYRFLLSQDDLAEIKKARQEEKDNAKGIDERLRELKIQGKTWTDVYRTLHIDRFNKIEQSRLKSLYKRL